MITNEMNFPMVDPTIVSDVFASGLGEVWDVGGGCYRFVFFANYPSRMEKIIVARLVMPIEAVPPALVLAAKAVGFSLAAGCYFPKIGLH